MILIESRCSFVVPVQARRLSLYPPLTLEMICRNSEFSINLPFASSSVALVDVSAGSGMGLNEENKAKHEPILKS